MNSLSSKVSLPVVAAIITTFVIISFTSSADGAAVKRSIIPQATTNSVVDIITTCVKTDACGWEVYNPSTRAHSYYVASSCRCSATDTCIRTEDDINVPAYVYRCRDIRNRTNGRLTAPKTTTNAPSS